MATPINKKFKAKIEKRAGFGWIHIAWTDSVTFFGSTKSVKVTGTMDGQEFKTAFLPWGDGTQFLPISAKLLKALKKQVGDTVEVHLQERL